MIKFFRKIRQNLLSEGKTGKYFKYAIGEIVLVMIGILLALQVNNWNEARKVANKELQLYSDILNDLESEYSKSEWNINRITNIDRFHVYLFNEANDDVTYDSKQYYNYLLWKHRYVTFIKEKYSESFASITNKGIHKKLKDYIDQENDTNDAVEEWNEHQLQYVRPFLTKYNISNTKAMFNKELDEFAPIINTTKLLDHSKLKEQFKSDEFEQLLFSIRFKTLWMSQNFIWLNDRNRELRLILTQKLISKNYAGNYNPILPQTIDEFVLIEKSPTEIIAILKKEVSNDLVFDFTEDEINEYGYDLMNDEKNDEALKVFKLNTQLYPDQWNTFDSYGECLLKLGDIELGIEAYKKSLELNPNNTTTKEVLAKYQNKG